MVLSKGRYLEHIVFYDATHFQKVDMIPYLKLGEAIVVRRKIIVWK